MLIAFCWMRNVSSRGHLTLPPMEQRLLRHINTLEGLVFPNFFAVTTQGLDIIWGTNQDKGCRLWGLQLQASSYSSCRSFFTESTEWGTMLAGLVYPLVGSWMAAHRHSYAEHTASAT